MLLPEIIMKHERMMAVRRVGEQALNALTSSHLQYLNEIVRGNVRGLL